MRQAWAAGSIFNLLHALVGLAFDVDEATLYADPHLPEWLPELKVLDMTVLDRPIDLRIWRDAGGETHIAITRGDHVRLAHRAFALGAGVPQ